MQIFFVRREMLYIHIAVCVQYCALDSFWLHAIGAYLLNTSRHRILINPSTWRRFIVQSIDLLSSDALVESHAYLALDGSNFISSNARTIIASAFVCRNPAKLKNTLCYWNVSHWKCLWKKIIALLRFFIFCSYCFHWINYVSIFRTASSFQFHLFYVHVIIAIPHCTTLLRLHGLCTPCSALCEKQQKSHVITWARIRRVLTPRKIEQLPTSLPDCHRLTD